MKRAWIAALLSLSACSDKHDEKGECCLPADPKPPAVVRTIARTDGVLLTGLPDSPELAACDARGKWGVKSPVFTHTIVDPKEKVPLIAGENGPKLTLYRDSLPFPQVNWKSGDWEVTQLLFPVGKGFAARYHVMNHGEEARTGTLVIAGPEGGADRLAAEGQAPASSLKFDLKCEPGVSLFFHVTTADLAGKVPEDALDQATAAWEKLLGNRGLKLPDAGVVADYTSNLAGRILGVAGCAEAAARTEAMLVTKEGNALRLLPAIPEPWHLEAIEAKEIPTDFGPLSFRYQGAYNNRTFELKPGCKPADGFLIPVPEKLVARIDGKDALVKDGFVRVPAGASFVEVSYPR